MDKFDKLMYTALAIIILGGSLLLWFLLIDGKYINKVITYPDYVDQYSLPVVGTVYNDDGSIKEHATYSPGESVKFQVAFCKNRSASGTTQYTLSNEVLVIFSSTPAKDAPIGCYPATEGEWLDVETPPIPNDAVEGIHNFAGVSTHTLPGNRTRRLEFALEPFEVK